MSAYAELAVTTNFSFLRGASHPHEMVAAADELGCFAIGIADRNSFAGVVRAYDEAKNRKIKLIVGVRLVTADGFEVLAYPTDRAAYGRLCKLLTIGNRKAKKGECHLTFEEIVAASEGQMFIALPPLTFPSSPVETGEGAIGGLRPPFLTQERRREASAMALARWKGREHQQQVENDSETSIQTPPPPCCAWAPSPSRGGCEDFTSRLAALVGAAPGRTFLAGCHYHRGDEPRRLGLLAELGERIGAPLVAVNDVSYHVPERRPLADIVTCIREKCTLAEAGLRLAVNAERHLKPPAEMTRLFKNFPDAIARTIDIAGACNFSLDQLKYEYPDEPVPEGKTAQQHLADLTWAGARDRYPKERYPDGIPADVVKRLNDELALIAKLNYARYFLTVHDLVHFARRQEKEILCQGRGSAANSAVCYCLGITSVNPDKTQLLFARFISENRSEPPDIDVDFEHERREEVIQYIYKRYGRDRAAICSTVVHYRSRRAIREVGKVLGLTEDVTAALARTVWGYSDGLPDEHIRQAGLDPFNPAIRQAVHLADGLIGFPRHLSQHVGGFVLTREPLDETVPIGNAAMEERTFIEWDKDDIDTLRLMKVDVLALGMLSCVRRGLDLLKAHYGKDYSLASLPQDDPAVYEMLSRADSIGVFQVESRAQMSMLPRLKPRSFYDLVIEVAIVRPGPIQGDMVHPYLRRRDGIDREHYPSPSPAHGPANELAEVLKRTLGVPLFQEQAMQIAITAAKFTPDEADGLRRAMATFRHNGTVHLFRDKFIDGMTARGYDRDFAENCFGQIEGFGEYGFPESHAASFALLVYASAWIKCRHPDVFCAAILNSQPMGFYQPAQLVRDARTHDVEIRAADVNFSDWDCTLEPGSSDRHSGAEQSEEPGIHNPGTGNMDSGLAATRRSGMTDKSTTQNPHHAVRLGFRLINGLREDETAKLVAARGNGFASIERLAAVAGVSRFTIERLAAADAFRSLPHDPAKWEPVRRQDHAENLKDGARPDAKPVPTFADRAPGLDRRAALWAARRLDAIGARPPRRLKRNTPLPDPPPQGESEQTLAANKKEDVLPLLTPHLSDELFPEPAVALPEMPLSEHVVEDYVTTGLSLKEHPVRFFRDRLTALGTKPNAQLRGDDLRQNMTVTVAGLVLVRQRPGTAKGVIFMTLEDETDIANIIVWPKAFANNRRVVMTSRFLAVRGRLQRAGLVIHVVAEKFFDLSAELPWLREGGDLFSPKLTGQHPLDSALPLKSRDFH
ncbi:MAG TPA: error-prone DNA polymerase [Xanthobacteraceae bacterium]|nr:error-prone DNA polymerase [Xanthobacteraceae bacterium]